MDKYQALQPLFDKYNKDPNAELTPMQKFVLDRLRLVQDETRSCNKQIADEAKKIDVLNKKIDEIRFRIVNLDGQNQSLLDTLLKLSEEPNEQP